jgi:histidinol-phosphate aminotransferase
MEHLVRDCYKGGGYVFATDALETAKASGWEDIALLASNENPEPPSLTAIRMAEEALKRANRYPDVQRGAFIEKLRNVHGDFDFVAGVGMDGIIETIIRIIIAPGDRVAISTPTFSFYGIAVRGQGGEVVNIPRRPDFSVDPDEFIGKCRGVKLAFLCSPNNPTGNAVHPNDVRKILEGFDGLLFLDNAYVEFCGIDYRPLMDEYSNLVLGRTMSKAYSLAGLRVGYAFVPAWLVSCYARAETPFALNSISLAAAEGALTDQQHVKEYVAQVERWRRRYMQEVKFGVFPSDANFVLVDVAPYTAAEVVDRLARQGVVVRSCASFPGLGDHYIRVSVGADPECERFIREVNALP